VLLKGSRGAALETVLHALESGAGETPGTPGQGG